MCSGAVKLDARRPLFTATLSTCVNKTEMLRSTATKPAEKFNAAASVLHAAS